MPWKPKSPCRVNTCPELAVKSGYCEIHAREHIKPRTDQRPNFRMRGYDSTWDKAREAHLKREPYCMECGSEKNLIVHHIIPVDDGGTHKRDNLVTLCRKCHSAEHGTTLQAQDELKYKRDFSKSAIPVVIVAGPPGSGKSSYVARHKMWGDLVVDVDALYQALSGLDWYEKPDQLLPFVCEARDAVIDRLKRESKVNKAWIISGSGDIGFLKKLKGELGAEKLVVIDTSETECVKRIANDPRRSDRAELWKDLVNKWFADYRKTMLFEGAV